MQTPLVHSVLPATPGRLRTGLGVPSAKGRKARPCTRVWGRQAGSSRFMGLRQDGGYSCERDSVTGHRRDQRPRSKGYSRPDAPANGGGEEKARPGKPHLGVQKNHGCTFSPDSGREVSRAPTSQHRGSKEKGSLSLPGFRVDTSLSSLPELVGPQRGTWWTQRGPSWESLMVPDST